MAETVAQRQAAEMRGYFRELVEEAARDAELEDAKKVKDMGEYIWEILSRSDSRLTDIKAVREHATENLRRLKYEATLMGHDGESAWEWALSRYEFRGC